MCLFFKNIPVVRGDRDFLFMQPMTARGVLYAFN
jgi:hypothetical protein